MPELLGSHAEAHSAAQRVLPGGGLGEPLEGALEIAASCGLPEGLPSIARILSDAIKGALPGIPRPLQVNHSWLVLILPVTRKFLMHGGLQDRWPIGLAFFASLTRQRCDKRKAGFEGWLYGIAGGQHGRL